MLISQWSPKTWNHWECCGFPSKSFCFLQLEAKSEQNQDLSRFQPVVPTRIPVMRGNDITPARRNRRHKSLPRIAPTGTCFLSHSRSNSSIKLWWHGAFNLGQVGLLGIQTKRLLMQNKRLPTYYPHLYACLLINYQNSKFQCIGKQHQPKGAMVETSNSDIVQYVEVRAFIQWLSQWNA